MISRPGKIRREDLLKRLKTNPPGLHDILADPDVVRGLKDDAAKNSDKAVIPADILDDYLKFAEFVRKNPSRMRAAGGHPVMVVPGFLGSSLTDVSGGNGLIWIDPTLVVDGEQLSALQLKKWQPTALERDAAVGVSVQPTGAVPLAYDLLTWRLSFSGYDVKVFPFDWRKNLEESAQSFARKIREVSAASNGKKVRVIAHSQGSLVARRCLQIMGKTEAERLVDMLVLLGPATFGTFTAAMAISGSHDQLKTFQSWAINAPSNIAEIFQSMSGLYQLLPWNQARFPSAHGQPLFHLDRLKDASFWKTGVDKSRLRDLFGWANQVDTAFFNPRTRIILGDDAKTAAAVEFKDGQMSVTESSAQGDGVVLDQCALLPGVRAFKAVGARHAWMAAAFNVTGAVLKIFEGSDPNLDRRGLEFAADGDGGVIGRIPLEHLGDSKRSTRAASGRKPPELAKPVDEARDANAKLQRIPAPPNQRRLRVFSLDPSLTTDASTAEFGVMEVSIPWEGTSGETGIKTELLPGPVGEYLEIVDVDPQSGRYYYPIDLNHPHVVSERGLTPSETDPQFHQQMVYAVAMASIRSFETALGRSALWAPRLVRDRSGKVDKTKTQEGYVQRLRIYPHAMRQRNAFYDPERKSLLFGYFPSQSSAGAIVQPGATVFTCLSFDIVAHETTHALLDGLHRYFNTPSNRDVFAFHEAFADVVALLQRFSNEDLMRRQIRLAKGKLTNESLVGQMARQFGEASGGRGGLRQYLGNFDANGQWQAVAPTPERLATENEPHQRGALLVAAIFQALNSMYEQRSNDLLDVARRDDGTVVFSRELENRLTREAADAAKHLLQMAIRALDYVPPVDISFGDYLRALITADCELVEHDKYHYRAAIVNAFSKWGIYPSLLQTLVPDDLRWEPPATSIADCLAEWLRANPISERGLGIDRVGAFHESQRLAASLHDWVLGFLPHQSPAFQREFGLDLDTGGNNRSIRRQGGIPVFEVHSVRPCRRVSPHGETRRDIVIEIVQRRKAFFDVDLQKQVDDGTIEYDKAVADFTFRGGCTLIADGRSGRIRYVISKNIASQQRLQAEREFRGDGGSHALAANYFQGLGEENPFRLMHADH